MTAKVGSFSTPTTTGNQAVTGLGFQPTVLILMSSGTQDTTWDSTTLRNCIGFATGASDQACVAEYYDNHGASSRSASYVFMVNYWTGGTRSKVASASLVSFDTDGFTLNWDAVEATARRVTYVALGGDISGKILAWDNNTVTGNQAITGAGFTPTAVFHIGNQIPSGGGLVANGLLSLGAYDGSNTFCQSHYLNDDWIVATNTLSRHNTTQCLVHQFSGAGAYITVEPISLDSDGFTVNITNTDGVAYTWYTLCLTGVNIKVGTFGKPTITGAQNQTVSGVGFEPGAVLLLGMQYPSMLPTEQTNQGAVHMGASDGSSHVSAISTSNGSRHQSAYRDESAPILFIRDDTETLKARADTLTFNTDGFDLHWSAVDTSDQAQYHYIAIDTVSAGDGSGGPGSGAGSGMQGMPGLFDNLTSGVGYVRWRAFIGPPWAPDDEPEFWDWSALDVDVDYDPETAIPPTTVAVTVGALDTSVTLTDAALWPAAGGFWMGPGESGEAWGYATYDALAGDVATLYERDTVDSEYTGIHKAGAVARFWWPLETASGEPRWRQSMSGAFSAVDWEVDLPGIVVPQAALRAGHLILIQKADYDPNLGDFEPWQNWLVGWLKDDGWQDDAAKRRPWNLAATSSGGLCQALKGPGLQVGATDLADSGQAVASSTLSPVYKDDSGEIVGEADVSPGAAIDGKLSTLWIAGKYLGENNVPPSGQSSAITQLHIVPRVGQGPGYRWIEVNINEIYTSQVGIVVGYEYYVLYTLPSAAYTANGWTIAFVENLTLFQEENPEQEVDEIVELSTMPLHKYTLEKQQIDNGSPTSGTWHLHDPKSGFTVYDLPYNASAAQVEGGLAWQGTPQFYNYRVTGPDGGPYEIWFIHMFKSENPGPFTVDRNTLSGGTGSTTITVLQDGGGTQDLAVSGATIFDQIRVAGDVVEMWNGAGRPDHWVMWGDWRPYLDYTMTVQYQDVVSGYPGPGETIRYIYDPPTPSGIGDYYEIGTIATPGYQISSDDMEWHMTSFEPISLVLVDDITDTSPAAGETLSLENAGEPSAEGLYATGIIQVGSEQMSYQNRDFATGTVEIVARAYGGSTAQAHAAGDTVYVVEGGIATDAHAVNRYEVSRDVGQPAIEHFIVRLSTYRNPRQPGDDDYYTDDWQYAVEVTGNALETYAVDLSPSQRVRHILVEIMAMADKVSRPRINEINVQVDPATLDQTSILENPTTAEAMTALLEAVGFPPGAILDNGDTPHVDGYTTEAGLIYTVLTDMADRDGVRLTFRRDSKVDIRLDPYWGGSGLPTEGGNLTRTEVSHVSVDRPSGRSLGQVELIWRPPDEDTEESVKWPDPPDRYGESRRVGPYVYADGTAALAGAQKHYLLQRRRYGVTAQLATDGSELEAGQVWGLLWDFASGSLSYDRTYLVTNLTRSIKAYAWIAAVSLLQLSRSDER